MSEEGIGAATGAVNGVAAGMMVGGPVGALVGGILGGIAGLFGGGASRARRLAYQKQLNMEKRAQAIQRRDMIREFRIAQAHSLAQAAMEEGGMQSSGSQAVQSSLGTQFGFNLAYFNQQATDWKYIVKHLKKSQQLSSYSNLFNAGLKAYTSFSGMGMFGGKTAGNGLGDMGVGADVAGWNPNIGDIPIATPGYGY